MQRIFWNMYDEISVGCCSHLDISYLQFNRIFYKTALLTIGHTSVLDREFDITPFISRSTQSRHMNK